MLKTEVTSIVEQLSHHEKIDLLLYLVNDVGFKASIETIQTYTRNGNGTHPQESLLDLLSWKENEIGELFDSEWEEETRIMANEIEAYRQMHDELLKKYPEQFVVIHQGKLVDRDIDETALIERAYRNYSGTPVLVQQVLPEIIQTIGIPSSMVRRSYA